MKTASSNIQEFAKNDSIYNTQQAQLTHVANPARRVLFATNVLI